MKIEGRVFRPSIFIPCGSGTRHDDANTDNRCRADVTSPAMGDAASTAPTEWRHTGNTPRGPPLGYRGDIGPDRVHLCWHSDCPTSLRRLEDVDHRTRR